MVTTIQLGEDIKSELSRLKFSSNDTYEDVIVELIESVRSKEREKIELLKEGYSLWSKELSKLNDDWSQVEEGWD
jgi:hypothetical protein